MVGRSESGHVIHRPGHEADRPLQSANRVSFRTANWSRDKPNKICF